MKSKRSSQFSSVIIKLTMNFVFTLGKNYNISYYTDTIFNFDQKTKIQKIKLRKR